MLTRALGVCLDEMFAKNLFSDTLDKNKKNEKVVPGMKENKLIGGLNFFPL